MQADTATALYSDVDPLYVAPFISESRRLLPLAGSLSRGDTHGVSLPAQVLVIAGWPFLPRQYFARLPTLA